MPTTYFDPYAGLPASDELVSTSTPGVPNPLWFLPSPLTVDNNWQGAQTFGGPVTFAGGVIGAGAGGGPVLAVAAVTATAGALVVNKHNPVDATSAPLTMTLPTGQAQGSIIIAEKFDSTTNAVTISGNIRGVPASTDTLVLPHQTTMFEVDGSGSYWPVSSHKALATTDARYLPPAHPKNAGFVGIDFPAAIIDAPTTGDTYASFPGLIDTYSGDLVAVWRVAAAHASGVTPGVLWGSTSTDGGHTWSTRRTVLSPATDPRDPCLYRPSGSRRIYCTYYLEALNNGVVTGVYVIWSDDDGVTWSSPNTIVAAAVAAGAPMHQKSNGTYYQPVYASGSNRSYAYTATDPTGAWTVAPNVYATGSCTEWDYVAVSPTNWIALVRNDAVSQMMAFQSTDEGLTWSAGTVLPALNAQCNGWPAPVLADDGRVLVFHRSTSGINCAQLFNTAAPLTAGNWSLADFASGKWMKGLALDYGGVDGATGSTGEFRPFRYNGALVGAYYVDTLGGVGPAQIRFGRLMQQSMAKGTSVVITDESTLSPNGFPVLLTTPDTVTVVSRGGPYMVRWQVNSYSAATIESWQVDVYLDGVKVDQTRYIHLCLAIGVATESAAGSAYTDQRQGPILLPAGTHTLDLRFSVGAGAVARHFRYRMLSVEPW